jgi:hypothetical protein
MLVDVVAFSSGSILRPRADFARGNSTLGSVGLAES